MTANKICSICDQQFDDDDHEFYPCACYYQICLFCWNETEKCPACGKRYEKNIDMGKVKTPKKLKKKKDIKETSKIQPSPSLSNLRMVQKNVLFIRNLPECLNFNSEELKEVSCFGHFGKVERVYLVNSEKPELASKPFLLYVTYTQECDAIRAICNLNRMRSDSMGKVVVSFGCTKYCNAYLHQERCNKHACRYLHKPMDSELVVDLFSDITKNILEVQKRVLNAHGHVASCFDKQCSHPVTIPPRFRKVLMSTDLPTKFMSKNKKVTPDVDISRDGDCLEPINLDFDPVLVARRGLQQELMREKLNLVNINLMATTMDRQHQQQSKIAPPLLLDDDDNAEELNVDSFSSSGSGSGSCGNGRGEADGREFLIGEVVRHPKCSCKKPPPSGLNNFSFIMQHSNKESEMQSRLGLTDAFPNNSSPHTPLEDPLLDELINNSKKSAPKFEYNKESEMTTNQQFCNETGENNSTNKYVEESSEINNLISSELNSDSTDGPCPVTDHNDGSYIILPTRIIHSVCLVPMMMQVYISPNSKKKL